MYQKRLAMDFLTSNRKFKEIGVPQGSVLWPQLFVIIIKYLVSFFNDQSSLTLYADDASAIISSSELQELSENANRMVMSMIALKNENSIIPNPENTTYLGFSPSSTQLESHPFIRNNNTLIRESPNLNL